MSRFPLSAMLPPLLLAAQVAAAQDAGMPAVDTQALQDAGNSLAAGFWSGVDHVANVLVDFLGRVFMKIAEAVLAVLHGVGIGTGR